MQLTKHSRVQLKWGHESIDENEMADQPNKDLSPFIGPELACGISIGVAKIEVTDWTETTGNTGIP
jgi:hypothetical protein